jgi:hypothetical protein
VTENATYYVVTVTGGSGPDGLARRRRTDDGGIVDEMLRRDLSWSSDSLVAEWERGDSTEELVEITEGEAEELIARFRERWGREG